MSLGLRQATPADLALTYEITREAMRGYVEQTWGRWDEDEQTRKHRENYTAETHRLILVERETAGLVATEPWPDDPHCLWLVKLYLLARFRAGASARRCCAVCWTRLERQGDQCVLSVCACCESTPGHRRSTGRTAFG